MGPIRTENRYQAEESSSRNSKPRRKRLREDITDTFTLPGVQKLKSSLRQTRRLLAKETLAADVRVETERRLKALEADIAQAEAAKRERTMAVRYHKVKFFERQKIVRKINQTKRQLSVNPNSPSARKKAEASLYDLRVNLNYVLHYPKSKKYISLFPPETRQGTSEAHRAASKIEAAKTNTLRNELRDWIREKMNKGELQLEPELHLDDRERDESHKTGTEWVAAYGSGIGKASKGKKNENSISRKTAGGVESDTFFGDDDNAQESSSEEDTNEDEDKNG